MLLKHLEQISPVALLPWERGGDGGQHYQQMELLQIGKQSEAGGHIRETARGNGIDVSRKQGTRSLWDLQKRSAVAHQLDFFHLRRIHTPFDITSVQMVHLR